MTDEKINPATDGYWWCQNCKNEIGAYHVTNQELHEDCGHPAEWITPVSALAQAREEGRIAGLREAAEIVLNGRFLHDEAPTKLFANEAAAAITRAAEGK
jgi:hypothetical protein